MTLACIQPLCHVQGFCLNCKLVAQFVPVDVCKMCQFNMYVFEYSVPLFGIQYDSVIRVNSEAKHLEET